ncbi:MAG: hypothetical protein AB1813_26320, partial [Verrucomicrobiota bacterium]
SIHRQTELANPSNGLSPFFLRLCFTLDSRDGRAMGNARETRLLSAARCGNDRARVNVNTRERIANHETIS